METRSKHMTVYCGNTQFMAHNKYLMNRSYLEYMIKNEGTFVSWYLEHTREMSCEPGKAIKSISLSM